MTLENTAKGTNVPIKKRKRKLSAMTNQEFCDKWLFQHSFCENIINGCSYCCPIIPSHRCFSQHFMCKPYKAYGKYIFIEVK